jgi:hypothetical protein
VKHFSELLLPVLVVVRPHVIFAEQGQHRCQNQDRAEPMMSSVGRSRRINPANGKAGNATTFSRMIRLEASIIRSTVVAARHAITISGIQLRSPNILTNEAYV